VQIHVDDDQTVGRTHAALIVDHGHVYIEDLASKWGTEINGQRILQRQLLYHNDHIRLGDSEFTFIQARPQDA
jgi:pSer/pThr/pTyr-binding forkhead associated (FHA) protein